MNSDSEMNTHTKDVQEEEFQENKKNVWILTVGMFLMSAGYTMIIPFLPVYLLELGTPKEDIALWSGAVFSITFLIAGFMAPLWGKLSDRKGRKLMVLRASFALGLTYFMGAFVQTDWQLFMVRAFQGFANGFMPAAMTLISTSVPQHKVGQAIGNFQTGLIAGQVLGPLIGGLLSTWFGMRPSYFIVGVMMTGVALVAAKWVEEPKKTKREEEVKQDTTIKEDLQLAWHNKSLLEILVFYFVVQSIVMMIQPIVAIYVGELLGSMSKAGLVAGTILSVAGIVGAIMTTVWSHYGQKTNYFRAVFIGFVGAGLANFGQGVLPFIWAFAVLQIVVSLFAVGITPSLSALVTLSTRPENRGRAYGLVTTSQQFGSMTGPLMASFVSTFLNLPSVFLLTGIISMIMAFRLWRKHKEDIQSQKNVPLHP